MDETELPEQPPIGGFCEKCGHFAFRHNQEGCQFPGGCNINCKAFLWQGVAWPRPWLPAPNGLKEQD